MSKGKKFKILETQNFGFIIGLLVIAGFILIAQNTSILSNIEIGIIDIHFNLKDVFTKESIQEGVSIETNNPNISPDILIIGIDFKALSKYGKWPFPRYRHANLVDSFTRIKNQGERERAIFLDIFFTEPDEEAADDVLVIESFKENGRIFLETILDESLPPSGTAEEFNQRQKVLYETCGELTNISGDWIEMDSFYGLQAPLQPYGASIHGFGHANFIMDDDEVFRRQRLIAKSSELLETYRLDELSTQMIIFPEKYERLEWLDKNGVHHTIDYPLTDRILEQLEKTMEDKAPVKSIDTTNDGNPDDFYYIIRKYKDHFVPSITLALALEYFNKTFTDIEVTLGKYIFVPHPEYFNTEEQKWVPYELTKKAAVYNAEGEVIEEAVTEVLNDLKIPIDEDGQMVINFMGYPSMADSRERQTFPIRSYYGYSNAPPGPDSSSWPRTKAVGNKILMVGAFARGMAEDSKPTPFGMMYGVEMHANALNTIIMNNFLVQVPYWVDFLVLFLFALFIAFISSRLSTVWSFILTLVLILGFFIVTSVLFDRNALLVTFITPAAASFFTFLSIVVYRAMTDEKDKKRIKGMFGTYVSPHVVDQILDNPPELGGVDKELTVFFSDIRGFTTISESLTPQELVSLLNKYLTAMTDIILSYDGTLDKYEGDAIMCFWGAPLPQEDHAFLACQAALKQMEALKALNNDLPEELQIDVGIGLNSGIMAVGNMGSSQRMDYTIMGDDVNLGSRLEGTNKSYKTNIIISEKTYGLVKDRVTVRELDIIRVKGKNKPVLIYELLDAVFEERNVEENDKTKKK